MKHVFTFCISLLMAMAVLADEWTVVSFEELEPGDEIVIGSHDYNVTAGTYSSMGYLSAIPSTFEGDYNEVITSLGAGTYIFIVGGTENAWTLTTTGGGLLSTPAPRKLNVEGNGTSTWKIVTWQTGDVVIESTDASCGTIQFNAASPRFTCTTASQQPIQLFRKGASKPKVKLSYQGFPYKRTSCEYPAYRAGSHITLPTARPKNAEGLVVVGWSYNNETYQPGGTFIMPEVDVELVPVWGEEGIESVQSSAVSIQKVLRDGRLIIVRDGVEYTILGGRVN